MLSFVNTPPHPPVAETVDSHVANFVSIAAWVWQDDSVVATGHVMVTGASAVTEKLDCPTTSAWQLLETVHVTVTLPPVSGGAPGLSCERALLQPPEEVAEAIHVL